MPSQADRERELGAWAEALGRALANERDDDGLRRRCLEWSRRFDWDRAADETERALFDAIAEREMGAP